MARDEQKQGNGRNNEGGECRDPMSMRQLTEALAAVTNKPRSCHENERAAAIHRRISLILTERMIEAICHALQNSQLRGRLRRHRRPRPNSPWDQPEGLN